MTLSDDGYAPSVGITNPLIIKAALYSRAAHTAVGQTRKYTGEPYYNHPNEVFQILMGHSTYVDEIEGAAAYLHDVVEDTHITIPDIYLEFGERVSNLVEELTDPPKGENYVRSEYKRIIREKYARASERARKVKMADIISNIAGFPDIKFKHTYFPEQRKLLMVIGEADPMLFALADSILASEGY